MQKQVELTPVLGAWKSHYRKEAMQKVGHLGPKVATQYVMKELLKKRTQMYARHDCALWKSWLPMIQLPIWLLVTETIRKMSGGEVGLLGLLFGKAGEVSGSGIEASLATEGGLWFPNLLLPDPYGALSFMLSGVMLLSLMTPRRANQALWQKRLVNAGRVVACLVGPLMIQAPSGLLLYWISSTGIAYIQHTLLDIFMPIKQPVEPCKKVTPSPLKKG